MSTKMKRHKIITLGIGALALAAGMTACQADMDTPDLQVPEATIQPNMTIAELKTEFQNKTELVGTKEDGSHYIIHGRVVSSDASGNIYQNLVVQDETAALTFSIRQGSMYTSYRLGQEVVVDMTGLYIGYYRGLQQVGAPGDPYDGAPQLGFMAYDNWLGHAQKTGLPNPDTKLVTYDEQWPADNMYCISLTLPISQGDLIRLQSQLVEIRNVSFSGADGKLTFAPKQETVSRYIKNEAGDSIAVRNSGYSNFYNDPLPMGTGNVRGILGYYGDSWQLTLRDRSDVMISNDGAKEKPFTVEQMLSGNYNMREGWATGYIVGSVKAGETATAADKVIFGKDAELDNNLLIADDPDCTDLSKCVTVDLTQGSMLRRYANLIDNPDVYKKKLSVLGTVGSYLGTTGMNDCPGTIGSFAIEGVEINVPTGDFKEVYHGLLETATSCDWTFDNVIMNSPVTRVWSWRDYNGKYYLNGSAYVGGANYEAVSYAMSPAYKKDKPDEPEIDLTGKLEAKASFDHEARFQTTLRTLCKFAVREVGQTEWTEYDIPTWPPSNEWTYANSGDIDISAFAGKKIQIAFKYASSEAGADTWRIKDAVVKAR